jgi:misacylated tRNA(Ala) deacylase
MATELVFRADAYARSCAATVVAHDEKGLILDRTVFYATSGGQPGDSGRLLLADGRTIGLATAVFCDPAKTVIAHVPEAGAALPAPGTAVTVEIDWEPRYRRMRMHTALHLLSVVLPYPVTGGSVGDAEGRLDFDIPDAGLDKDELTLRLNDLIARDAAVSDRTITEAELDANPGLVKTMSVQPPRGTGVVRLVEIAGLDLQPCGGTHVKRTGEIGRMALTQIEKKGKMNRRVRIAFA